jgi:hypothetical protein
MVRDMDLVRHILLEVERADPGRHGWPKIDLAGYRPEVVGAHIGLLGQAGLLEVADARTQQSPNSWIPKRLTWAGHDFLDAIRNETVMAGVKAKAKEFGGSLPFEVMKELAMSIAKGLIGAS